MYQVPCHEPLHAQKPYRQGIADDAAPNTHFLKGWTGRSQTNFEWKVNVRVYCKVIANGGTKGNSKEKNDCSKAGMTSFHVKEWPRQSMPANKQINSQLFTQ